MSDRIHLSGCPVGQEIVPECEVVYIQNEADLEQCAKDCQKNPGHHNFFAVNEFNPDNLPPEFRTVKMMRDIYKTSILTLRVRVPYTSFNRPKTFADSCAPYPYAEYKDDNTHVRYGTGSIVEVLYYQPSKGKPCPCPPCKKSDNPKMMFWWIRARTATHVIFDRSEARHAQFDCFYDMDGKGKNNRKGVKTIYGFDAFMMLTRAKNKHPNDVFDVLCVTHDHETVAILNDIMPPDYFLYPPVAVKKRAPYQAIVSHPHGCAKRITFGKVLHQTIPLGSKFPVDTPIPFEKGTKYRQQLKDGTTVVVDENKGDILANDDSCYKRFDVQLNELKETLKTSDVYNHYKTMMDEANTTYVNFTSDMRKVSYQRFLVDFYFIYMAEKCLKILLMAAIKHQKNNREELPHGQQVTEAYKEVCAVFLEKEYGPTSDPTADQNPGNGKETLINEPKIRDWIHLLKESVEQLSAFKSNRDNMKTREENRQKVPSFVAAWFDELEKILNSILDKTEQELDVQIEDLLPDVTEKVLKSGLVLISKYFVEQNTSQQRHDDNDNRDVQKPAVDQHDVEIEKDKANETEGCCSKTDNISGDNTGVTPDCGVEVNSGDVEGNKDKKEIEKDEIVSEGSTFTLPPNAEYAFRVYSHSPGWISFPPNTIMTMPDGTRKDIGGPQALEFQFPTVLPEFSYVTYDIKTCPGSSGANIFCNILAKSIGTYYPHSGYNKQDEVNKSGIRDNLFALYNRSFMFSQNNGDDKPKKKPDVIDFSKTLLQGQINMLNKL